MKQIAKRIAALAAAILLCLPLFGCRNDSYLDSMIGELNRISEEAGLSYRVEEQIRTTDRGTVWITFWEWGEAASYSTLHITSDDQGRDLKKGYSFSIYNDVSESFVIDCLTGLCLLEEPEWDVAETQAKVAEFWATRSMTDYSEFLDCGSTRLVCWPHNEGVGYFALYSVSLEQWKADINFSEYRSISEEAARNPRNIGSKYLFRGTIITEPYQYRYMDQASSGNFLLVFERFEVQDEQGSVYTMQYYKSDPPVTFQKGDTFQFYGSLTNYPEENEKGYPLLRLDWFEE